MVTIEYFRLSKKPGSGFPAFEKQAGETVACSGAFL